VTFSQPSAGGDKFEPKDHFGNLLLVYPKSYNPAEQTSNGVTPAADVDIIVVDKPGPDGRPLFINDARFFGNLAKSVRNDVGSQVLGRLGQGPNTRGTPPWILTNFTDADAAAAGPVHAAYQAGQFKPAENPMAPAAPGPAAPAQWQAPAAPGAAQPAPQQQWQQPPAAAPAPAQQQWQAPAPSSTPPTAPPAAAAAPTVDPNLVAFLASKGVTVQPGMDQATCEAIARGFQ
jgi:hypothetical protein